MEKIVLIMAGGSGTRFWPLSTEDKPKQFLNLVSEKSMIRETIERTAKIIPFEKIFIATNIKYLENIKKEIPEIPAENIILEPVARDTAACIAYAGLIIKKKYPESIMAVLPSDHLIEKEDEFLKNLCKAFEKAEADCIITLGIKPTYPETGYGYIEYKKSDTDREMCSVKSFREKPNFETAEKYIEKGNFLWNSGMFIWKTDLIIEEIKKYMPSHKTVLEKIEDKLEGKKLSGTELSEYVKEIFNEFEKISIDFGVMEKSKLVNVIPIDIGWNDVGSFKSLEEVFPKDKEGNIIREEAEGTYYELDSEDNIIINKEDKIIATIGLEHFVVVNTGDALLICHKDKTQEIKKMMDKINK
jgi:mannose-1-phosphate guanylyltransferase